jgi:ABC-type dipeptide/oligopeptide/nickel transport system ATPase subunit
MDLVIKNCNNIDSGEITLKPNVLNIKYAINGTGKTSVSKAIQYSLDENYSLDDLIPFKFRNGEELSDENKPSVIGIEGINSISIFNEDYVNQYVFKQREILANSFEIFIKNENYDQKIEQIETLIKGIKDTFSQSDSLKNLIDDLTELSNCFGKSKSGYSAAGSIGKGIGKGNKVAHIPEGLEDYSEYITNENNLQWVKWQVSGSPFLDITNKCPYCTSTEIETKKEKIKKVAEEYDAKMIEHLNKVLSVFTRLNEYFTDDTNRKIQEITSNNDGITKEQKTFLIHVKEQIDNLIERLLKIRELGYFSLKEVDKVAEEFEQNKINLDYYEYLNTEKTNGLSNEINKAIDSVIAKAGQLTGEIRQQNIGIQRTIEKYKKEINTFLKYSGYKYQIDIELDESKEYKMVLKHKEHPDVINNVNKHLSFGERNAFSLVLFMYDSLHKNTDLIILDDPISSFDKNKKFAILNMLFRGSESFSGKTVLMMSHDFEPIIDMLYNLPHKFQPKPFISFLSTDNGTLNEIEVKREDIKTFMEIAKENVVLLDESINRAIYLRRLYEISLDKSEAYNLISNLFKKRDEPINRVYNEATGEFVELPMTAGEIATGESQISEYIEDFNYDQFLTRVKDTSTMVSIYENSGNNYEKLQIYRIICNENHDNEIIRKFVNETFHIENDYILQLNPCKFELVPSYIINECNEDLRQLGLIE